MVVAGDFCPSRRKDVCLPVWRGICGDLPIALALGNRDYYLTEDWAETQSREWPGFLRLRRYWKESCVDNRIVLLDDENLDLGELVVASGYGHYDLGFAVPGFSLRGTPVTEEHYTYGSIQRRMRRSEDQARHPWD